MSGSGWTGFWPYAVLTALAFGVYASTLWNGFVWDDSAQLLRNPVIVDFHKIPDVFLQDVWAFQQGAPKSNYYRPFPVLTYMAMYHLAGFSAAAFHGLMVLIHVANTVLVFFLSRHFLRNFTYSLDASFFAAALFAVHPIHTEAVAWVAALPDLLLTFVTLFTLVHFIRQNANPAPRQVPGYALSYAICLLTKETGVVLFALLVGFEALYLRRRPSEIWKNRGLYATLLIIFCIYLFLRIQALGSLAPAQGRNVQLGAREFALNAIVIAGSYLAKLAVPTNLSSYHIFEPVTHITIAVLLSAAAMILIGIAMYLCRSRVPLISFAIFSVVMPLVPALNLTGIGEAVFAERYLYLPSVGFTWIAGLGWLWLSNRSRLTARISALTVLGLFSYAVIARTPDWHDDISLYSVTARQYPNSGHIRTMLAQAYQAKGRNTQAVAEFHAAVDLDPGNAILRNSLATALAQTGQQESAIAELEKATIISPSYWPAFVNLAVLYDRAGQHEKSAAAYKRVLQVNPNSLEALIGLAVLRKESRDYTAAVDLLRQATSIEPNATEAHLNLGFVYIETAQYGDAVSAFRKAIAIGSDYPFLYLAHYGLGVAEARLNHLQTAAEEFATTLLLNPDYAPARQALEQTRTILRK